MQVWLFYFHVWVWLSFETKEMYICHNLKIPKLWLCYVKLSKRVFLPYYIWCPETLYSNGVVKYTVNAFPYCKHPNADWIVYLVHVVIIARASLGRRRIKQRSCCCVRKMADRFSRFNEERDFQVILLRVMVVEWNVLAC